MSPEAQCIAIAEACGWKRCWSGAQVWYEKDGRAICHREDMFDNLNAMHEAENVLIVDPVKELIYTRHLGEIAQAAGIPHWHATAAQRREAFLRTIGKWKESVAA